MEQMLCIAANVVEIRAFWDKAEVCRPNSLEIMLFDAKTRFDLVKVHMRAFGVFFFLHT